MINYSRQNIDKDDIKSVVETLKSDFLTQGPMVVDFEDKFKSYIDSDYCLAVSNATAGLHLACKALKKKKNFRVITTPITFAASANCVRYCGGEVWFCDINPETYLICEISLKKLLDSYPKNFFDGIILVNFGGLMCDLEKFQKIARNYSLWLIEDAAHSPGAYFIDSNKNRIKSGSCVYNNISVFSFHPVKHIACGEGGMISTNNSKLNSKLNLYRSHGTSKLNNSKKPDWFYDISELGYNYRLTDIQSALGISQLKKNNNGLIKRNEIAENYKSQLSGKIKFQKYSDNFFHAYHLFVIEVNNRDELYKIFKTHGYKCQIHYTPIHTFSYYKKIGYEDADLRNSEKYYSRCLSIPFFPDLNINHQEKIIELVLKYAK